MTQLIAARDACAAVDCRERIILLSRAAVGAAGAAAVGACVGFFGFGDGRAATGVLAEVLAVGRQKVTVFAVDFNAYDA